MAVAAAFATAFAAVPAHATGTVLCRSPDRAGLEIYLVVGFLAGPVISQARIVDGTEEITTGENERSPRVAQSWLSERELRLDVTDWNLEAFVARLNANSRRDGGPYQGTLVYRGRTHRLTCESEDG